MTDHSNTGDSIAAAHIIEARGIAKGYAAEGVVTPVLAGVDLDVARGEFLAVTGRSGSGKSTLLSILATLMRPDAGTLHFDGREVTAMTEGQVNELRRRDLAVIFQMHHLLPYLTALENVLLPFMQGLAPVGRDLMDRARESLLRVGLGGKEQRLPGRLSGGEQQRVAIARALVKQARVLFADEPTGSLDKATGESIMSLLMDLNTDGLTVVMVTHDPAYAACAHRVAAMEAVAAAAATAACPSGLPHRAA